MLPDIVYILKDTNENPELKYSIRSVQKNFPGHRIVFVGGCPKGLEPDLQISTIQVGDKWENARHNILTVCRDNTLTEDIYLFNDDFFVIKKMDEIPTYINGDLKEFIEMVEGRTGMTDFTKRLRNTYRVLNENNLPTINYEVHVPMLVNREKILDMVEKYPRAIIRTMYGNLYNVKGVEIDPKGRMQDGVQQNDKLEIRKDRVLVSTTDESFAGVAGREIKKLFNRRSKYER